MIAIIAAIAKNNVVGKLGGLPWYIPEDLKRFRELTTGHMVIMGRKTYESIIAKLGKPLPNRTSVVITRNNNYKTQEGVITVANLEQALKKFTEQDIFIIGGGQIYHEGLFFADVLYITHIDSEHDGDVFFPNIDWIEWVEISREQKNGYSFAVYKRKPYLTLNV